jgi:hypothetical protein
MSSESMYHLGLPGFLVLLALWLVTKLYSYVWHTSHSGGTKLRGPPSKSRLFGLSQYLAGTKDVGAVYEEWAARYGPVYEIPDTFGSKKIVLTDPKALTHFYNSERTVYVKTEVDRLFIDKIVCPAASMLLAAHSPVSSGEVYCGRKGTCTNGPSDLSIQIALERPDLIRVSSRQRKALTPAFSNAAIRRLTSVFFDSAYKVLPVFNLNVCFG